MGLRKPSINHTYFELHLDEKTCNNGYEYGNVEIKNLTSISCSCQQQLFVDVSYASGSQHKHFLILGVQIENKIRHTFDMRKRCAILD